MVGTQAHAPARPYKRKVPVKLTRRARRHLGRGHPLPTQLKLTFRDPDGRKITETHRVTILPRRRP